MRYEVGENLPDIEATITRLELYDTEVQTDA
jgi:hypothetical protein